MSRIRWAHVLRTPAQAAAHEGLRFHDLPHHTARSPFIVHRSTSRNNQKAGSRQAIGMVPADVACFGRELARRLAEALDGGLVGAYFVGSIALGGYVADESDVDIVAVSEHRVPAGAKLLVANAVLDCTTGCPARGLEFTLYRQKVAGAPPRGANFEVNANGGTRMPRSVHLDADAEPGFWYVLDQAIAHRAGIAIVGPPGCQVFADVPRDALLAAMKDSMRWHRAHEGATLYSVLNASRAWRFAAEDALGSKLEGAAWARSRWPNPELIDSAVALRHGKPADLRASQVDEFLEYVEGVLSNALEGRR